MVLHKLFVIQPLFYKAFRDKVKKIYIASRSDGQINIRTLCCFRKSWVDYHNLETLFFCFFYLVMKDYMRLCRVCTRQNKQICSKNIIHSKRNKVRTDGFFMCYNRT